MTTFREVVRTETLADAAITALVGTRMYPDKLPQKPTYPLLVYSGTSEDDTEYRAHDSTPTERMLTFVQFECYSDRDQPDTAAELADAVSVRWSGYQDKPNIGRAFVINRFQNPNDALNAYREIVEVEIEHARTLV